MPFLRRLPPILCLLSYTICVPAAHITDKLLAGVYEKPIEQGQPIRILPSGTPLEILEKKGDFSQVRLSDHTQGWVQSRYITDEKPAQVMLLETQARASALEQELQATQEKLALTQQRLKTIEQNQRPAQDRQETQAAEANQRIAELAQQLEAAKTANEIGLKSIPYWYLLTGIFLLLLGFVAGMALFNHRFRKRFGGLRL